ncbi:uncharacterized protein G2W53_017368 [Senna tora]|uniref:Uncharacterized protein n=1 Tax=Senna tora TaxID=362788 RepID=A0A834WQT6_9FABA|nr:uncharacterized protein G2W53_017368 [Senna tora]
MAAAEARAVWQRTANRCFVQEDAKRAPKLACCQPSCATSKLVDAGALNAADESDHTAISVPPFNRKSSFSNLSPDTRWWLHMQPSYGYQKGLTHEQLKALEDEVEIMKASDENETFKGDVTYPCEEEHDSFYHMDRMQGEYSENSQTSAELMDIAGKQETVEIDGVGSSVSKQMNEFCLDSEYSWIEGNKTEPWWRTTDRDELASFVSQKLLDHIENCDLPPPRRKYVRRDPCTSIGDDKIRTACFDWETKSFGSAHFTAQEQGSSDPRLLHGKQGPSANEEPLRYASEKSSSYTTMHKEQGFEGDPSKVQLMEALCHSQTRAREAEEAAKQAYAEKEDVVKLIFKQASQLFAYKQWLRMLQLETLYNQINNKDQPISALFPVALPWMTCEGRKPLKRKQKLSTNEGERPRNDNITTYAVALALGLSLVGAGLLLGWTVGWMLPHL